MESENERRRAILEELVPEFSSSVSNQVGNFIERARDLPKLVECLILLIIHKVGSRREV